MGLSLLLVIAAPAFFLGLFLIKQKLIQAQMEERLEQSQLQTVVLPVNSVSWINDGKEVMLDGKLFDIRSYTVSGNTITLNGLFDNDEDHLIAKMNDTIHKNKDNGSSPLNTLALKFLSQQVYNDIASISLSISWKIVDSPATFFTSSLAEAHCFLAVPPPKAA